MSLIIEKRSFRMIWWGIVVFLYELMEGDKNTFMVVRGERWVTINSKKLSTIGIQCHLIYYFSNQIITLLNKFFVDLLFIQRFSKSFIPFLWTKSTWGIIFKPSYFASLVLWFNKLGFRLLKSWMIYFSPVLYFFCSWILKIFI